MNLNREGKAVKVSDAEERRRVVGDAGFLLWAAISSVLASLRGSASSLSLDWTVLSLPLFSGQQSLHHKTAAIYA